MTLHLKTLIICIVTFISLTLILYLTTRSLVMQSFADLEERHTREHVQQAVNAVNNGIDSLYTFLADWASWDDTYAFIQDRNPDYIESNLVDSTFVNSQLNLIMLVDAAGRTVYARAFDRQAESDMPLPARLQNLAPEDPLLSHVSMDGGVKGLLNLPGTPMLIAARPILTSLDRGPARGTMLMGRYLDAATSAEIAQSVRLPLNIEPLSATQLMPAGADARSALLAQDIYVQPLDESEIAGYAVLSGIDGQPAVLLRVATPRDIYDQGQATVSYLLMVILVSGLVFGTASILLIETTVVARTVNLSHNVDAIGLSGDHSARVGVKGTDELGKLGKHINGMLENLEQVKNKLTDSEKRYRLLAENAGDVIWTVNLQMQPTYISPSIKQLLGYTAEEAMAKKMEEIFAPHSYKLAMETLNQVMEAEKQQPESRSYVLQIDLVRKNGANVPTEISFSPIRDEWGVAVAILAIARDISERKQMQHQLEKKNEKLDAQNEELRRQSVELKARQEELREKNEQLDARNEELLVQRQQLQEKSRELEEANQAKSQFIAHVSHELRTPLNSIIGFSELLIDGVPGEINAEQRGCLQDILNSGQHLLAIINDVLDLSRIEARRLEMRMETLGVAEVIADAAKIVKPLLDENRHALNVEVADDLPPVFADKSRLKQIIINLLGNAIKFTPSGGKLGVKAVRDGDFCQISVYDNGIGIPPKDQAHIFDPFTKVETSAARKGAGLGLSVARQLVEKMGGEIWVKSEAGMGSTFIFTIPVARNAYG